MANYELSKIKKVMQWGVSASWPGPRQFSGLGGGQTGPSGAHSGPLRGGHMRVVIPCAPGAPGGAIAWNSSRLSRTRVHLALIFTNHTISHIANDHPEEYLR
ncbi:MULTISPECIES: hypothetical protein [Nitrosomonas]|uniref:hypothetical protein n=1 Tax=Nitrosomonas TaxID=914 RepID=UPI0011876C1D|nr:MULTISPECIES: hypothetical protein [Nitrosomonas]UVS60035.1 hypothetical protein NX761_10830 [Nitrosomonas sp. PLL12]